MHIKKEPPCLTPEKLKEKAEYARRKEFNIIQIFAMPIGAMEALEKNNMVDIRKIVLMKKDELAKMLPSPAGYGLAILSEGLRQIGLDLEMTELPPEYRD
jgi:hypothetical protein